MLLSAISVGYYCRIEKFSFSFNLNSDFLIHSWSLYFANLAIMLWGFLSDLLCKRWASWNSVSPTFQISSSVWMKCFSIFVFMVNLLNATKDKFEWVCSCRKFSLNSQFYEVIIKVFYFCPSFCYFMVVILFFVYHFILFLCPRDKESGKHINLPLSVRSSVRI
jgi:hypothetical protein